MFNNVKHSTKMFMLSEDRRTFIAEISDFGREEPLFCNTPHWRGPGFVLVSHKTGRELPMVKFMEDRTVDGELAGEWFKPQDSHLNDPVLGQIRVLIIND